MGWGWRCGRLPYQSEAELLRLAEPGLTGAEMSAVILVCQWRPGGVVRSLAFPIFLCPIVAGLA